MIKVIASPTPNNNDHQEKATMRDYTRIFIEGAWVMPLGGTIIDIINPATESPAGQIYALYGSRC
jgi:hypothetical protein